MLDEWMYTTWKHGPRFCICANGRMDRPFIRWSWSMFVEDQKMQFWVKVWESLMYRQLETRKSGLRFCFVLFFVDYEKTTKWSCSWIKEGKYGLLLVFWEIVLITYIENIISFAKYTVCCITNLYLLNIVKFFSVSCAQHFFFFPQTNFLAKPRELLKSGQVVPCPLSVNEYEQVYFFNF